MQRIIKIEKGFHCPAPLAVIQPDKGKRQNHPILTIQEDLIKRPEKAPYSVHIDVSSQTNSTKYSKQTHLPKALPYQIPHYTHRDKQKLILCFHRTWNNCFDEFDYRKKLRCFKIRE